jgi:hypothetical protein
MQLASWKDRSGKEHNDLRLVLNSNDGRLETSSGDLQIIDPWVVYLSKLRMKVA